VPGGIRTPNLLIRGQMKHRRHEFFASYRAAQKRVYHCRECVSLGKAYLLGRRVPVNSHRAGGGGNRPDPFTRHRNTGCCSECVAHFLRSLHEPLWLCRAHYVLARISRKCRCAEYEREHDACASNRRTAQATKSVSYSHAVNMIPFRILRKLI
jgi:hypothetical protein